jgi:hypothetical protein
LSSTKRTMKLVERFAQCFVDVRSADLIEHEVINEEALLSHLGGTRPSNSKLVRRPMTFLPSGLRAPTDVICTTSPPSF